MGEVKTNLKSAFGGVLRDLRESAGLSQEKLALESGLDRTFISMLERGLRQPTLSTIFTVAEALGKRPSAMLAKVEDMLSRG